METTKNFNPYWKESDASAPNAESSASFGLKNVFRLNPKFNLTNLNSIMRTKPRKNQKNHNLKKKLI